MHTSTDHTTPTTRRRGARLIPGLAVGLGTAALVLIGPAAASAHVHVTPSSTEAGSTSMLAFSFDHGCEGSPTTAVEVTMPDEIASMALIANAGWGVAAVVEGGARTVVFTADEPMPDGVRETLEVEVNLADDVADGTVLAFPALQVCETGETLWGDLEAGSDTPAPILTIGETADAHGHESGGGHDHGAGEASGEGEQAGAAAADAGAGEPSAAMPLAITALVIAVVAAALAAVAVVRRRA